MANIIICHDSILKYADRLSDNRILAVMDAYLNRIHDGYNEMVKLDCFSQAYEDVCKRVYHCSKMYRMYVSYIFSERSWRVWSEHFNRWPNENQALPVSCRAEPQTPAFLPVS